MALEAKNIYFRYNEHTLFDTAPGSRMNGHPRYESPIDFHSNKQPWILENQSIVLEKGDCLALSAPSGYGKTTFAMILAGYLKPVQGEILLDGRPIAGKGVCPVQLISQHPEKAINPRWRLKRVLEESGEYRQEILEALGIEQAWLSRFPRELSGGELQRFCVARALMSNADYLICDEISTMLDVITQAQIWHVILTEAKKRNIGIMAITHNKHLAEKIATKIIQLP